MILKDYTKAEIRILKSGTQLGGFSSSMERYFKMFGILWSS